MEILRLWISSGDQSPVSYCPFCNLLRKSGQRIQATSFPFQTTEVMDSKKWIPAQEISTKRRKAQSPKASRDGAHLLEGASQCVCQSIHCVGETDLVGSLGTKTAMGRKGRIPMVLAAQLCTAISPTSCQSPEEGPQGTKTPLYFSLCHVK